jgi:hypothetical protein
MAKIVKDFLGYDVGDVITLSDIQTQVEYNALSADFIIQGIRIYRHPEGAFKYTAYIANYKHGTEEERQIMLLIRQVGTDFDMRVFYLNTDGISEQYPLFSDTGEDLVDRFEVDINFPDGDLPVTWDKQGDSNFGIETTVTGNNEINCKTIAEYFTNDETKGNPHCFIEWTGDMIGGYIEIWYGCDIRVDDVEIFHNHKI